MIRIIIIGFIAGIIARLLSPGPNNPSGFILTTDPSGNYTVVSLPLGPQELKAEKTGFKTAVRTGVDLVVGQKAVVNFRLELGEFAIEQYIRARKR